MFVNIKFPARCSTVKEKQEFINELVQWGIENLNDQENWKYKTLLFVSPRYNVKHTTTSVSFNLENEADAVALKLVWCET